MVKKSSVQKSRKGGTFWDALPKPFFVLAPMANVTDFAFRSMIAKYGMPDVMWNEFVSADGLNSPGKARLMHDLLFSKKERPIVAQLFTGHPEAMKAAAQLCAELGFDGIDINMGCPDRAVEKQGGGAAHIRDPKKALEVLNAARDCGLPVSVKTRIGYNRVEMDWLRTLLEQKLPALTVHLRTRKEMSDVPAHWELMPEIVKLRDEVQAGIPPGERTHIIGNGDVLTVAEAHEKCAKYGCDGVMIGRGIFGTPWLFEDKEAIRKLGAKAKFSRPKTPEERLAIMLEHAKLFDKTYCGAKHLKNFAVMKKHFKAYVSGWDGAKELRVKLMETSGYREVKKIVDEYLQG
ncbi:MAG: tRNA-dihydrouridine synthase [Patescibacteria group bacterium]